MSTSAREILKTAARAAATVAVLPALGSYFVRAAILGRDRALEGSTQALALVPGLLGQYFRRAFLMRVLAHCAKTSVVEFGTIFAMADARLDDNVYIGPRCTIGLAHLERDVLIAPGVQIPSGPMAHGIADPSMPAREQPGRRQMVTVGAGAWVGAAAIVMADVGAGAIVGAGAVVTKPIPEYVVAGGVPARVLRARNQLTPADRVLKAK